MQKKWNFAWYLESWLTNMHKLSFIEHLTAFKQPETSYKN